ncbi:MAG: thiamine pyrophosphate-dependent enzyme [Anaerolineae bacterium]
MYQVRRRGLMVTLAPGIGQEACTVGGLMALDRSRDGFVPQYREAAAKLCTATRWCKAFWRMGGPIGFTPRRFKDAALQAGVSGQIGHAVGLAWESRKLQGKSDVVVVSFGEGGSSQGDFYEPLNLAGVVKAPVIFLCQNNNWAISTPRELQTAAPTLAQKGAAAGVPGIQVDGNDLLAMYGATCEAVERARRGDGPTLIEAMTYRLGIHTTADDGARYEPPHLKEEWRDKDPILRLQRYLEKRGKWNEAVGEAMEAEIQAELDTAWEETQRYPINRTEEGLTHVFAEMTPRLRQQYEELSGSSEQ